MATQTLPGNSVLVLDVGQTNELLLEPTLAYGDVLSGTTDGGLFHIEVGKDKMTMSHLNKPRFNLQPKSNCKTWNPTVRYGLRSDEIVVSDYEVNGEQCNDEFDKGNARNLQGLQDDKLFFDKNPGLDPLQQAMVMTLRESIRDDVYRTVWFSDTKFNASGYAYEANLDLANAGMAPEERTNLTNMMNIQDGVWKEIQSYVADSKIRYVDTNDGNASGNALDPANITSFLRQLRISSDNKLKFWGYGPGSNILNRPYYLLQYGLFEAYMEYLRSTGSEEAHRLIVQGIPVPGVYTFDGHIVMAVPEWSMWDSEIGMLDTSHGYSKVQRAIFTVPENISILANAKSIAGFADQGLIIQQSTQVRDKGVMWMYYAFGFGMSIAHNDLLTVGFNSELDTWNFSATYNNAFSTDLSLP